MQNVTTGQTITCQGEELLLVCKYVSGSIEIAIKMTDGSFEPMQFITESKGHTLKGTAGTVYRVTHTAGLVNVHGACVVA